MIIRTRRSSLGYVVDTLLTAVAWIGFIYLIVKSLLLIYSNNDETWLYISANFLAVIYCLLAIIICSGIFLLWAHYRVRRRGRPSHASVDTQARAVRYNLSLNTLSEATNSRLSTIHHSNTGEVTAIDHAISDMVIRSTDERISM